MKSEPNTGKPNHRGRLIRPSALSLPGENQSGL
jgi:hypothetical protein